MIYLLHFERPISEWHTCQHYVGFTDMTPENRLAQHKNGYGARLTQVANERGIDYWMVRLWHGDRADERKFKSLKAANYYCPICQDRPRVWRFQKEIGILHGILDVERLSSYTYLSKCDLYENP